MIIWVRCNIHREAKPEICTRCKTVQDMNDRQAQALLDAGATPGQVMDSYGRRNGQWI